MNQINQRRFILSIAFSAIAIVYLISAPPILCVTKAWKALGPYGGSVSALGIDPSHPKTIYTAIEGVGLFKSTDGGSRWEKTRLTISAIFFAIEFRPGNSQTVYAATSEGLYISSNGGKTWTQSLSAYVLSIAIDPVTPNNIYVGTWGGLSKTSNGG